MTTPAIRHAKPGEGHTVAGIIAESFHALALSQWLVPDPVAREQVLPAHFALFTEHAIDHATVYLTEDHTAAAVWLPSDGMPEIPDFERRNKQACADRVAYFDTLGACFDDNHPHHAAHDYLQFLGVLPRAQGRGIGSAMMQAHHAVAGAAGTPTYLEASNEDSRRMYIRHGYRDFAEPIRPAEDAPYLYPLWRDADA